MNNYFRLKFPSHACNESFARMAAAGFIMELDPTCEEIAEVKTAVSEAVTNAIIHGYKNCIGDVVLEGVIDDTTVSFTVSDSGEGIEDIELARVPLYTGAPDMERSGMGFTIMEAFMDEVRVNSKVGGGCEVVLIKKFEKGECSFGG